MEAGRGGWPWENVWNMQNLSGSQQEPPPPPPRLSSFIHTGPAAPIALAFPLLAGSLLLFKPQDQSHCSSEIFLRSPSPGTAVLNNNNVYVVLSSLNAIMPPFLTSIILINYSFLSIALCCYRNVTLYQSHAQKTRCSFCLQDSEFIKSQGCT